jgi:glycosyltransferase involved in cell wall biosynthesis
VAAALDGFSVPFVVWFYGSDAFRGSPRACVAKVLRAGAFLCCTSNALRDRLVEAGCPTGRVHVFYPGVYVPEFLPRRDASRRRLRILSVGRLCDVKNPEGLVHVAGLLREQGVDYSWECLGEGPLRPAVEKAVSQLGVETRFRLHGSVPHGQVIEHMLGADVLVHNATIAPDGGRESFGVVLAEASAAALPIVSVRVGGIPEIVQDGETGYLVDEGDLAAMAGRIEQLGRDASLRQRMGCAAYRWAMANVEATSQTEKLDRFYDALSEQKRPR